MSRKITIGKNGVDFKQAAGMVREYQKSLNDKCLQLCRELCSAGVTVARVKIGDSGFGRHITLSSEITPEQAGCKAVLYMVTAMDDKDRIPRYSLASSVPYTLL